MRRADGPLSGVLVSVVAVVLAFAALRLLTLLLALQDGDLGLHVDEAQYWHWSTTLAWGYYSKPPVIAALLAGATRLFGNGVAGVKSVGLILFPLTGLVLGLLAASMVDKKAEKTTEKRAAGMLAAAFFLASPLAAVLGLAATTDAPLLLCWALATALFWHAREAAADGRSARATWLALGLVCGIGLLSKYSFAAWILGALAWAGVDRFNDSDGQANTARRTQRLGLLAAAGVTLALLLPHLAWNAAVGWPTLQHTAEITQVQHDGGVALAPWRAIAAALLRSLSVPLGVLLMAGPLLVLVAGPLRALLRPASTPTRFLLVLHLPLLALGMLQALRGEPQINWVAPLVPGLVLLLALALVAQPLRPWLLAGLVGLHTAVGAAVPLAQTLSHRWQADVNPQAAHLPRRLDIWARMRGWPQAFDGLRPALLQALRQDPDAPLLTDSRSVIAIGAYVWRDLPLRWRAWFEGGLPHSHYEMTAPWPGARPAAGTVLIVADAPLPDALLARLDTPEALARASGAAGSHSTVTLTLWRARVRGDLPDDLPPPRTSR